MARKNSAILTTAPAVVKPARAPRAPKAAPMPTLDETLATAKKVLEENGYRVTKKRQQK